jgi:hypothetical protein
MIHGASGKQGIKALAETYSAAALTHVGLIESLNIISRRLFCVFRCELGLILPISKQSGV